jgi:hypothetical protein
MIENNGVLFLRRGSKHAAKHLPIEADLLRRPRENAATNIGHIPALSQHHAVDDNIDLAALQPGQSLRSALGVPAFCCALWYTSA